MQKLKDKLLSRVLATPCGCWEYTGSRDADGHGKLNHQGKQVRAHRLSFKLFNGDLPDDLLVRHSCDNPPCINPEHLLAGTVKQNSEDAVERGRQARGETQGLHKLTEAQVSEIRARRPVESCRALAAEYGVSPAAISNISANKWWKHVA